MYRNGPQAVQLIDPEPGDLANATQHKPIEPGDLFRLKSLQSAQLSPDGKTVVYVHRCTTPTLLLQHEHDYRCPADQSEQFYAVLKANGCIADLDESLCAGHRGPGNK